MPPVKNERDAPNAPVTNSAAPSLTLNGDVVADAPTASSSPQQTSLGGQSSTPTEQKEIGDRYFYGRGVEQDYAKAMGWYPKPADQGFADAQFMLGRLYANGLGVFKDYDQAKMWYKRAADQGNSAAKYSLQRLGGADTPAAPAASTPKMPTAPLALSAPDAPATPRAQYDAGFKYEIGLGGAMQDYQQAVYWYRKAAIRVTRTHNTGLAGFTKTDWASARTTTKLRGGTGRLPFRGTHSRLPLWMGFKESSAVGLRAGADFANIKSCLW
jgi:hypothetical protein